MHRWAWSLPRSQYQGVYLHTHCARQMQFSHGRRADYSDSNVSPWLVGERYTAGYTGGRMGICCGTSSYVEESASYLIHWLDKEEHVQQRQEPLLPLPSEQQPQIENWFGLTNFIRIIKQFYQMGSSKKGEPLTISEMMTFNSGLTETFVSRLFSQVPTTSRTNRLVD